MSEINKELIIIGSGPAGLRAAQLAKEANLDYLVLEKGRVAQAWWDIRPDMLMLSPCLPQRDWTSLSQKFPIWKMDVHRPFCTAAEFAAYLEAFADHFQLEIKTKTSVMHVKRDDLFYVVDESGNRYSSPVLIVGTGIFGNPFIPDIPGVRNNPYVMHSHFYRSADDFKKQKVLVIGAGNSAAEIAIDLVGYSMVYLVSREELKYFSDTHRLYHIRGVYESYLKELISMEIIRYKAFQQIEHIEANQVIFRDWELSVDKIIFATGYHGDLSILRDFNLRVNKKNYPEVTEHGESIQYPRLFFIGPLAYQSMASNVIHGFLRYIPRTIKRIQEVLR